MTALLEILTAPNLAFNDEWPDGEGYYWRGDGWLYLQERNNDRVVYGNYFRPRRIDAMVAGDLFLDAQVAWDRSEIDQLDALFRYQGASPPMLAEDLGQAPEICPGCKGRILRFAAGHYLEAAHRGQTYHLACAPTVEVPCGNCGGSGKVVVLHHRLFWTKAIPEDCGPCDGRGRIKRPAP